MLQFREIQNRQQYSGNGGSSERSSVHQKSGRTLRADREWHAFVLLASAHNSAGDRSVVRPRDGVRAAGDEHFDMAHVEPSGQHGVRCVRLGRSGDCAPDWNRDCVSSGVLATLCVGHRSTRYRTVCENYYKNYKCIYSLLLAANSVLYNSLLE